MLDKCRAGAEWGQKKPSELCECISERARLFSELMFSWHVTCLNEEKRGLPVSLWLYWEINSSVSVKLSRGPPSKPSCFSFLPLLKGHDIIADWNLKDTCACVCVDWVRHSLAACKLQRWSVSQFFCAVNHSDIFTVLFGLFTFTVSQTSPS